MTADIRLGDWRLNPANGWTTHRAAGLKVLAVHDIARVSSIFQTSHMPPTIWREVAIWLADRDLIEITSRGLGATCQLTDAGRTFVKALDRRGVHA